MAEIKGATTEKKEKKSQKQAESGNSSMGETAAEGGRRVICYRAISVATSNEHVEVVIS